MSKDKSTRFIFANGLELDVLKSCQSNELYRYFPRDVKLVKTIKIKRVRF